MAPARSEIAPGGSSQQIGLQLRQLTLELGAWLRYGYGAIGAAFAAQFWLLAAMCRHAAGARWAWMSYAGTLLAWFAVDSAACVVHGAWFNVLMVNLPAISLGALLLAWARPR